MTRDDHIIHLFVAAAAVLTVKEGSECRISFPFMENSLRDRDGRQTTLTHLYSSRSSSSHFFFNSSFKDKMLISLGVQSPL